MRWYEESFRVTASASRPERYADVVGTNLTGVFNTVKATAPAMIAGNRGGSITLTRPRIRGMRSMADYTASKHGVVGLMRTFANELADHDINTVADRRAGALGRELTAGGGEAVASRGLNRNQHDTAIVQVVTRV